MKPTTRNRLGDLLAMMFALAVLPIFFAMMWLEVRRDRRRDGLL